MKFFLKLWLFFIPLPLYFGAFFYMSSRGYEEVRLLTVFIVPVLYGYLIPYISTTIMKKWEFLGGIKLGGIYIHQGFKIASHLVLWLSLVCALNIAQPFTAGKIIILSFFGGVSQGFIIWIHDILAIKYGYLKMNNGAFLSGMPAEVVTYKFAPFTFFALGFVYILSSLMILDGYTVLNIPLTGFIAFIVLTITVSLVYKYCESSLDA